MSTRKTQRRKYQNKQRGKSRSKPRRKSYNKSRRKKIHKKNIAGSSNVPLSDSSLQILLNLRKANSSDKLDFFERLLVLYENKIDKKLSVDTLARLKKEISPDKSKRTRILNNIKDIDIRKLVTEISEIVERNMVFHKKGGARQGYYRPATTCEIVIGIIILIGKGIAGLTIVYLSLLTLCGGDHECAERHMEGIGNVINFINDIIFAFEHPVLSTFV